MNWILRFFWMMWGKQMLVREAKRRSLAVYLRALRATRLGVLGFLFTFLFLQLMMISAVGVLVTGIYLWDHDFQAKIEILFWIFTGTFCVPALIVGILMSEFLWFRMSGAKKLMEDLSKN